MLIVSYVHGGMLHEEFARCLSDFYRYDAGQRGRQIVGGQCHIRGLYVADSRNHACRRFIDAQYPNGVKPEWLLFLDTDIVFKPEDVYALLDAADPVERPIVGGLYFGYLDGECHPVWRKIHKNTQDGIHRWGTLEEVSLGTIAPVDAVGMGFTIIHRNVIEKLAKEYANDNWTWFAHDLWGNERLGEDLTFCYRAAQHGYKTFGDSRIIVGHIKSGTITVDNFFASVEKSNAKKQADPASANQ